MVLIASSVISEYVTPKGVELSPVHACCAQVARLCHRCDQYAGLWAAVFCHLCIKRLGTSSRSLM